jgi:hypothetical protein
MIRTACAAAARRRTAVTGLSRALTMIQTIV